MLVYVLLLVALSIIALLILAPIRRARRRRELAVQAFPAQWHQLLAARWRLYGHLPPAVLGRVQRQLQVMMAETRFYGCNGLEVTDEMRVLVLAQAALLYGNVIQDRLSDFPHVLLYPDAFVREGAMADELGLVAEERHVLLGESWEQGKVILSWADIEQDLLQLDGHNLVIHEYAHQVDGYDGVMNGTPPLGGRPAFAAWPDTMQAAYDDLCRRVDAGDESFDPYGTTNPAEFFSVVSEYFFTLPRVLHERYPDVYRLLAAFYRLDTLDFVPGQDASDGATLIH